VPKCAATLRLITASLTQAYTAVRVGEIPDIRLIESTSIAARSAAIRAKATRSWVTSWQPVVLQPETGGTAQVVTSAPDLGATVGVSKDRQCWF